jgi:Integrase core domain
LVIAPGEPWRNGEVESCTSRIRDQCLTSNSFWSLAQARVVASDWTEDDNHRRRHRSLGDQAGGRRPSHLRPPVIDAHRHRALFGPTGSSRA